MTPEEKKLIANLGTQIKNLEAKFNIELDDVRTRLNPSVQAIPDQAIPECNGIVAIRVNNDSPEDPTKLGKKFVNEYLNPFCQKYNIQNITVNWTRKNEQRV